MPTPSLTLNIARTTAVRVPLTYALGTSAAIVTSVPLLLLDLETREGVVGRCYIFCYTTSGAKAVAAHLVDAVERLRGSPIHPQTLADQMARRFALIGVTGTVRMALSALDMALWDACACAEGKPVADLLGGTRRPIRAYDSRGLGLMDPARLAAEAESMRASGLPAMKLRLGHPTLAEDLAALHAVRGAIGDDVLLMVDYNQALLPTEAILRGRAIEDQGVVWLEEPIRHDDYPGNARIARELTIPIQIGENFNGP
ncbi:MAG: enolase C-terminal domain-like protein, partial [Albidovulum sp.]